MALVPYNSADTSSSLMSRLGVNPAALRANLSSQLVATTINPRSYATQPPDRPNRTAVTEKVEGNGNFIVDERALVQNGGDVDQVVPTGSGMVLWYTDRGVEDAMYRYGFVPAGTTCVPNVLGSATAPAFLVPTLGFTNVRTPFDPTTSATSSVGSLIFTAQLAVPYGSRIAGDIITFDPDIARNFETTLTFAGNALLYSDTVAGGANNLNGWATASAVASTPDLSQVGLQAYPSTALKVAATIGKDAVLDVPAWDGVATVQGPDIPSRFTVPDSSTRDHLDGVWATFDATAGQYPSGAAGPTIDTTGLDNQQWIASAYWITPWNITMTANPAGAGTDWQAPQIIRTDPIGQDSVLDIALRSDLFLDAGTGAGSDSDGQLLCVATHVFMTVQSDHRVYFQCFPEEQYGDFQHLDGVPFKQANTTYTFHPTKFRNKMSQNGMYIGTYITEVMKVFNTVAASTVHLNKLPAADENRDPQIFVRARTIGDPSSTGSARIMRWDAITNDQVIRLRSTLLCMCLSKASIAPFVQFASKHAAAALDLNAFLYLQALYRATTLLCRVYTRSGYLEVIKKYFGGEAPSIQMVLDWAEQHPEVAGAAEASGAFGDIASAIGNVVGGVGHIVEGLAAGEFGAAGGQFGETRAGGGAYAGGNYAQVQVPLMSMAGRRMREM